MNSFQPNLNQSAACLPVDPDFRPEELNGNRPRTEPNREVSIAEVQLEVNDLPLENPPQSHIGLPSYNPPRSNEALSGFGPVSVIQAGNSQGASNTVPVVISNNQLSQPQAGRTGYACKDFKRDCDTYCSCNETNDRRVQVARCVTFHGLCTACSVATAGCWGVVYCITALWCLRPNSGPSINVCRPSSFKRSCFPGDY